MLSDIIVLSLEQATTLPFLTYRLACDGARVIRIENPKRPDPNRFVGPKVLDEDGMNSYFLPNNCGKEAITLNLASEEGRTILHKLVKNLDVDIFACNQRPRSYARLGIEYETLRQLKSKLIWVGITGFGPNHDEAAYDPILQARSGFMDLTGETDGTPTVFGLPMVDLGAGEHGYGQVMKALYQRTKTGEGSRIDVSMYRSAVSWMVNPVLLTYSLGQTVTRRGNTHPYFAPVSVYPTEDGHVYLAIGNDRQWQAVTGLPGFTGLDRLEYRQNSGRIADVHNLNRQMADCLRSLTTVKALDLFQNIGVPISKVNAVTDVVADPLVADTLTTVSDPYSNLTIVLPAPPVTPAPSLRFPPRLGEHNQTVYGQALGYSEKRLADLQARNII